MTSEWAFPVFHCFFSIRGAYHLKNELHLTGLEMFEEVAL